jgi:GT2 family glycosyltransferase
MPIQGIMQVHILKPYDQQKNLGKAYNTAMAMLPEDSAACLCDIDTCFLTPDAGSILQEYVYRNPDAGILTCLTNRVSPLSKPQLLGRTISDNSDMRTHLKYAAEVKNQLFNTTEIDRDISGFLMVVSKKVWLQHPFPELGKAIGVDTQYGRTIRAAGLKILRMDGLYIWHTYRLLNGIADKTHLQP